MDMERRYDAALIHAAAVYGTVPSSRQPAMTNGAKRGIQVDREDDGCLYEDQGVLVQTKVWAVIEGEQANHQADVKFSHGRWWMTFGSTLAKQQRLLNGVRDFSRRPEGTSPQVSSLWSLEPSDGTKSVQYRIDVGYGINDLLPVVQQPLCGPCTISA